MRIAICDDSEPMRKEIMDHVRNCDLLSESVAFTQFSTAEELLEAYQPGAGFDVIFMDVEMGETNGIQAGIKIREMDSSVVIVMVSGYPKYALSAYECEPIYFLVKPLEAKEVQKVLSKVIKKYKMLHQYYLIRNRGDVKRVRVNDILYVEIYRKHLVFHTSDGRHETTGRLAEVLEVLSPCGFCQVHQGFLVNMEHIKDFLQYDILLDNEEKVMMSVRKRADVIRKYAEYMEKSYI